MDDAAMPVVGGRLALAQRTGGKLMIARPFRDYVPQQSVSGAPTFQFRI
jgi:hypothetical protein